jgi:hypothetical protein
MSLMQRGWLFKDSNGKIFSYGPKHPHVSLVSRDSLPLYLWKRYRVDKIDKEMQQQPLYSQIIYKRFR